MIEGTIFVLCVGLGAAAYAAKIAREARAIESEFRTDIEAGRAAQIDRLRAKDLKSFQAAGD